MQWIYTCIYVLTSEKKNVFNMLVILKYPVVINEGLKKQIECTDCI